MAEEFTGQFKYLGENTETSITFLAPIKREVDNCKRSACKIKFIHSFRFMSSLLFDLADNLYEGHYNNKFIDWKSYLDRYQSEMIN